MSKAWERPTRKFPHTAAKPKEREDESLHPMLKMQQLSGNSAVVNLLEGRGLVQTKPKTIAPGKEHLSSTVPQIQRASRDGNSASAVKPNPTPENAPETAASTAGPLIVEDDAATVAPGQMRKSEFLEQLRVEVCATADAALQEAGESTKGCPYLEQWLSYYAEREPAHIERALRKYAPEAATATNARDYIPAVSNRVRRGVDTWAKTGELTGVPDELRGMLTGPGAALGAIGGILGSTGSAIGGAVSAVAGAIGGAFSSIGKALFKRKEGHAAATDDPQEIQAQLGSGQPLDGGAKSRLGAAFGQDFSGVRVHTNAGAAGLSNQLNARAFTVGSDVAFGAGEYQPGTLIGDALIAHELAHVVQQGNGSAAGLPFSKGANAHDSLEEDADVSAVGAVVSAWGGVKGAIADIGRSAMPRMRSGLRLQRCKSEPNIKLNKEEARDPEKAIAARRTVAEAITIVEGTADEKDKEVVVDELVKMPIAGLGALKKKGVKVVVCRNSVTEIREDLKGVRPRGWPEGKTWDTVPGLNDPNNNRVIIATRNGRVPPPGDGHDAHNLVLHEVGHAVGDAVVGGGVDDPKFIEAREKDKAKLDPYETQAGNVGTRETFAESFARFYGDDPKDAKTYPHLHAYWATNPLIADAE
jgi:hypothetical protein